jgi:hypothetical protein
MNADQILKYYFFKIQFLIIPSTSNTSELQGGGGLKHDKCKGKGKVVPLHAIEVHLGDTRYSSCSFLTPALEGGEWSASRPGRALTPGKEPPVPTVQEAGWAPDRGLPVCSKILYWLSYPAHPQTLYWEKYSDWGQRCDRNMQNISYLIRNFITVLTLTHYKDGQFKENYYMDGNVARMGEMRNTY